MHRLLFCVAYVLATHVLPSFASIATAQVDSSWLAPTDGDWADATNWSTSPTAPISPGDTATLSATGNPYTATISTPVTVDQITIDSPAASVLLQGGTLSATSGVHANQGPLVIESGTIANTRLEGAAGIQATREPTTTSLFGLQLENVTLATTLSAASESEGAYISLKDSLSLDNGEIQVGEKLALVTSGPLSIGGNGVITVDGCCQTGWYLRNSDTDIEMQAGVTLRAVDGGDLYMTENSWPPRYGSFTNHGTIEAVGGRITIASDVAFASADGVLRATEGGELVFQDVDGEIGTIELGENSQITLGGEPILTQPITVSNAATFALTGNWQSNTDVEVAGGTVRVSSAPVTGTWNWGSGSTIEISSTIAYADLVDFGVAGDTLISTINSANVSLSETTVDLATSPGVWDMSSARFISGTITGLPNGGMLSSPTDNLLLSGITLDTPLEVAAGLLRLQGSNIVAQPLLIRGGEVSLTATWSNPGGITVDGGRLDISILPDSIGQITLQSGEVVLPSLPTTPSELQVSGGTLELENVNYTIPDLQSLPWTPEVFAAGYRSNFDLEGSVFDLSAGPWAIGLAGGTILNGTIRASNDDATFRARGGTLNNIVIETNIEATETVSLTGSVHAEGVTLAGYYRLSSSDVAVLDDVTIDGEMTVGGSYGSPAAVIVRNQLTVNGLMELGTRYLQIEGTQTISGVGEMDTYGIRGAPGGGIEVVDGSLTLGSGFTFRSRRNGSKINVDGPVFTNEGTIIADVDEYGAQHQDVAEPGLTIAVNGNPFSRQDFFQNGTMIVVDGYEIRVEAFEIHNAGEIELRGGDLTGSGVELINTGEFRGRGLFVSTGDGRFTNQGMLSVGDMESFDEHPAAQIGQLHIAADFEQDSAGALAMDLAGPVGGIDSDLLSILGSATLAGLLEVTLLDDFLPQAGELYTLLSATGGIEGEFDQVAIVSPSLALEWSLVYGSNTVSMMFDFLDGDFTANGAVDGADFLAWQLGGSDVPLDADDLADWQANYGVPASSAAASASVPEPSTSALLLIVVCVVCSWQQGYVSRIPR